MFSLNWEMAYSVLYNSFLQKGAESVCSDCQRWTGFNSSEIHRTKRKASCWMVVVRKETDDVFSLLHLKLIIAIEACLYS